MSNILEYTNLGRGVVAFTTQRALGRDRERLCQMLCIDNAHLVIPHQTHGKQIYKVTSALLAFDEEMVKQELEGIDAVITNERGVCIGVSTADCIPVLLYDEKNHAVAAIHAGWKGTVQRIVQDTLRMMVREYGTAPADVKAAIGPGISLKNFEVGDEVYDRFAQEGFDMKTIAQRFAVKSPTQSEANTSLFTLHSSLEKWHIDLWECNRLQLIEKGVKAENIHVEEICTYDNTNMFFSARREQKGTVKCGRNFNAIMLKTDNL